MRSPVVLVAMPWALLEFPPISLGILNSVLRRVGIEPVVHCYNLLFQDFVSKRLPPGMPPLTFQDYHEIASFSAGRGLGDWIFALPPLRDTLPEEEQQYLTYLSQARALSPELLRKARWLREQVPAFIDTCVEELLRHEPALVGFTTTFNQNVPSLLLAKRLKERDPRIQIVFGGANCDGPMGKALHTAFPWVDVVVQGEAEGLVVDLFREILDGRGITPRAGLLVRGMEARGHDDGAPRPRMDEIPTPNYDFYFEELERCSFREELLSLIQLPVETARGCWWGQKQHCTFCGLNGSSMAFRSKSAEHALEDFVSLATRYKVLDFAAVDNIIDLEYLKELLPRLKEKGLDLRIFYETKANLSKEQVRNMRAAGINRIQPGIESLSTPILKLMRKGVAAWQNVRLLKWCAQFGIGVDWNLLYGFPKESADEYARMSAFVPALTHLQPPSITRLQIQRFSPYHQTPEQFGIQLNGPSTHYQFIYPAKGAVLNDIAYSFEFSYLDGRNPEDYVGALRQEIAAWQANYDKNKGALTYRRGPGFIRITDSREPFGYTRYVLEGEQAVAYLACDAGASAAMVCRAIQEAGLSPIPEAEVEEFLRELVEARLVFESDKRFVSLALPASPEQDIAPAPPSEALQDQPARAALATAR